MIEALILLCELCCMVLLLWNLLKSLKGNTETSSGFFAYIDTPITPPPAKGPNRA